MRPELKIQTPEGVIFSYQLAGPVVRFLAWLIDFVCILILWIALTEVASHLSVVSPDFSRALIILSGFAVLIGYGMVTEWYWRGQTVGKRFLMLRVIDEQGFRLQPQQIVVRNLLRAIDVLPGAYLVGGLACFLSPRAQRLGDFAAGTVVVRIPKIEEPDLEQISIGPFNSLRQFPHLEARLRQRLSPHEAMIALQAIIRRDDLNPSDRIDLFRDLAAHLKSLAAFPPEAVEHLTDEQYVRNVVEILFRPPGSRTETSNSA
jgi:uncharacterized RDD family membrane protein YckC